MRRCLKVPRNDHSFHNHISRRGCSFLKKANGTLDFYILQGAIPNISCYIYIVTHVQQNLLYSVVKNVLYNLASFNTFFKTSHIKYQTQNLQILPKLKKAQKKLYDKICYQHVLYLRNLVLTKKMLKDSNHSKYSEKREWTKAGIKPIS